MSTQRTPNCRFPYWQLGDRNWHVPYQELCLSLDGQAALSTLYVRPLETPSSTLNVVVTPGQFVNSLAQLVTFAGASPVLLAAASVTLLWLDDAGTIHQGGAWPTGAFYVPLARVSTDAATVTAIVDCRISWASLGGTSPYVPLAGGTMTGLLILSGAPAVANGAATKGYVDGGISSAVATLNSAIASATTLLTASQSAGYFIGSPSGAAGTPVMRRLAFADLPVLAPIAVTDGATVTFNAASGPDQSVTLGGNRTLAITNDADGTAIEITLKQDATGSRTVTWWPGIRWPGGTAPTLTTTAGKEDVFRIERRASGNYRGIILGQGF